MDEDLKMRLNRIEESGFVRLFRGNHLGCWGGWSRSNVISNRRNWRDVFRSGLWMNAFARWIILLLDLKGLLNALYKWSNAKMPNTHTYMNTYKIHSNTSIHTEYTYIHVYIQNTQYTYIYANIQNTYTYINTYQRHIHT